MWAFLLPALGHLFIPVAKVIVGRPDPTYRKYYGQLIVAAAGLIGLWTGLDLSIEQNTVATLLLVFQPILANLIGNRR